MYIKNSSLKLYKKKIIKEFTNFDYERWVKNNFLRFETQVI